MSTASTGMFEKGFNLLWCLRWEFNKNYECKWIVTSGNYWILILALQFGRNWITDQSHSITVYYKVNNICIFWSDFDSKSWRFCVECFRNSVFTTTLKIAFAYWNRNFYKCFTLITKLPYILLAIASLHVQNMRRFVDLHNRASIKN